MTERGGCHNNKRRGCLVANTIVAILSLLVMNSQIVDLNL